MPAEQDLQEQLQQSEQHLRSQWDVDFESLKHRGYDKEQFNRAYKQLFAKHQNLLGNTRFKFKQETLKIQQEQRKQQQEQQRVRELIQQPKQRTRGEEATLRMQLDPEAERLAFPEKKYISPSYLRSGGFIDNMSTYAGAASDTPGWEWGPPKKQKQDLIDQYQRWRQSELYNNKSVGERQQLDREWDMLMSSSSIYDKWWDDKAKHQPVTGARALRATGKIAGAMKEKVAGKTPIGRALIKEKSKGTVYGWGTRGMRAIPAHEPEPETESKPIRQRNRRTGQERISYDGGKTWQTTG